MTLVVCETVEGCFVMTGDTAMTAHDCKPRRHPVLEGCLKQYILDDGRSAVAFAGDESEIDRIFSQVISSASAEDAVNSIVAAQLNGAEFESIVATIGQPTFRLIKGGLVARVKYGHIGDDAAATDYANFLRGDAPVSVWRQNTAAVVFYVLRGAEPQAVYELSSRSFLAMKAVIDNQRHHVVGGIVVPMIGGLNSINYQFYNDTISSPIDFEAGGNLLFGSAVEGSYAIGFGTNTEFDSSDTSLGVYFTSGNFGVAFPAGSGFRRAVVVKGEHYFDWAVQTAQLTGKAIAAGCSLLTKEQCAAHCGNLLSAGRLEDALVLYDFMSMENLDSMTDNRMRDVYAAGYGTALFNTGRQSEAVNFLEVHCTRYRDSPECTKHLGRMLTILRG